MFCVGEPEEAAEERLLQRRGRGVRGQNRQGREDGTSQQMVASNGE